MDRVGENRGKAIGELEIQIRLSPHRAFEQILDLAHLGREVPGENLELPPARVGEQLTREMGGDFGPPDDLAQVLLGRFVGGELAPGGTGVAEDARQEVVEVVGDPARQYVQALESLGVLKFVFECASLAEFVGADREAAADRPDHRDPHHEEHRARENRQCDRRFDALFGGIEVSAQIRVE